MKIWFKLRHTKYISVIYLSYFMCFQFFFKLSIFRVRLKMMSLNRIGPISHTMTVDGIVTSVSCILRAQSFLEIFFRENLIAICLLEAEDHSS